MDLIRFLSKMEINRLNTIIHMKNYSNYTNVEKDTDKIQEDKINYLKDNLVLSEEGKLSTADDFKELFEWTGKIGRAGEKDKDSFINGTVEKYYEILRQIDEADLDDETRTQKKERLERAFDTNVGLYSSSVKIKIWLIENRDSLGIHFNGTAPQKSYELMDRDTAKQVESDVKSMFYNAKKYYKEHGNLKGITSKIINGDSNTISSTDLGLLEEMEKHMDDYFGNAYAYSKSADDVKVQAKQKVSEVRLSDFMKNLFFKFIDEKFSK